MKAAAFKEATILLLTANVGVFVTMGIVHALGKDSVASWLLIYGPIFCINMVSLRDQVPILYIASQWLVILHGLAHAV